MIRIHSTLCLNSINNPKMRTLVSQVSFVFIGCATINFTFCYFSPYLSANRINRVLYSSPLLLYLHWIHRLRPGQFSVNLPKWGFERETYCLLSQYAISIIRWWKCSISYVVLYVDWLGEWSLDVRKLDHGQKFWGEPPSPLEVKL